jgi:hypothetical protein
MMRTENSHFIDKVAIAAPCKVDWATMTGDEKRRFCEKCSLHVYNLSAMTKTEAEELLSEKSDNLCLRFFRRADGTIIFENCPVGLRRIRDGFKFSLKIVASFLTAIVSTVATLAAENASSEDQQSTPSKIKLNWTLIENGPTQRVFPIFNSNWKPATAPLAQLGVPDKYANGPIINPPRTSAIGSDWAASDHFHVAMKNADEGKVAEAKTQFAKAFELSSTPESDPMFHEFIGDEYARALRNTGEFAEASRIETTSRADKIIKEKSIDSKAAALPSCNFKTEPISIDKNIRGAGE